jgi:hypothetical protein
VSKTDISDGDMELVSPRRARAQPVRCGCGERHFGCAVGRQHLAQPLPNHPAWGNCRRANARMFAPLVTLVSAVSASQGTRRTGDSVHRSQSRDIPSTSGTRAVNQNEERSHAILTRKPAIEVLQKGLTRPSLYLGAWNPARTASSAPLRKHCQDAMPRQS